MSWRLFGQIVLLIIIYWGVSFGWGWLHQRQADAAFHARMDQIHNDSENNLREISERSGL